MAWRIDLLCSSYRNAFAYRLHAMKRYWFLILLFFTPLAHWLWWPTIIRRDPIIEEMLGIEGCIKTTAIILSSAACMMLVSFLCSVCSSTSLTLKRSCTVLLRLNIVCWIIGLVGLLSYQLFISSYIPYKYDNSYVTATDFASLEFKVLIQTNPDIQDAVSKFTIAHNSGCLILSIWLIVIVILFILNQK